MINGLDRAFCYARFAVDALIRMDVKHLFSLVKALDRAYHHTVGVPASHARLGYNVRHVFIPYRFAKSLKNNYLQIGRICGDTGSNNLQI